jgi:hypothetical protein
VSELRHISHDVETALDELLGRRLGATPNERELLGAKGDPAAARLGQQLVADEVPYPAVHWCAVVASLVQSCAQLGSQQLQQPRAFHRQ